MKKLYELILEKVVTKVRNLNEKIAYKWQRGVAAFLVLTSVLSPLTANATGKPDSTNGSEYGDEVSSPLLNPGNNVLSGVSLDDPDGKVEKTVIMKNYPEGKTLISKQDATTGKELEGASLVLKDSKGNIVDEWVSGKEPHLVEGLKPGKYTLTETYAPEGYIKTEETVEFTVDKDGNVKNYTETSEYISYISDNIFTFVDLGSPCNETHTHVLGEKNAFFKFSGGLVRVTSNGSYTIYPEYRLVDGGFSDKWTYCVLEIPSNGTGSLTEYWYFNVKLNTMYKLPKTFLYTYNQNIDDGILKYYCADSEQSEKIVKRLLVFDLAPFHQHYNYDYDITTDNYKIYTVHTDNYYGEHDGFVIFKNKQGSTVRILSFDDLYLSFGWYISNYFEEADIAVFRKKSVIDGKSTNKTQNSSLGASLALKLYDDPDYNHSLLYSGYFNDTYTLVFDNLLVANDNKHGYWYLFSATSGYYLGGPFRGKPQIEEIQFEGETLYYKVMESNKDGGTSNAVLITPDGVKLSIGNIEEVFYGTNNDQLVDNATSFGLKYDVFCNDEGYLYAAYNYSNDCSSCLTAPLVYGDDDKQYSITSNSLELGKTLVRTLEE